LETKAFKAIVKQNSVISVVGLAKNAGKTTLINYFLQQIDRPNMRVLVCTIGRDGEKRDIVASVEKPGIHVFPGDRVLSSTAVNLPYHAFEIEESFSIGASQSGIIMAKALMEVDVELVGPRSMDTLDQVIRSIKKSEFVDLVLVDGALNRIAHSRAGLADGVFLVANPSDASQVAEVVQHIGIVVRSLSTEPVSKSTLRFIEKNRGTRVRSMVFSRDFKQCSISSKSWLEEFHQTHPSIDKPIVFSEGVLTDRIAHSFWKMMRPMVLVVQDGSRILLSPRSYNRLERAGILIRVIHPINLLGLAVNSLGVRHSVDPTELEASVKESFPNLWVLDVFRESYRANSV
jgi:hypothetical protein